MNNNYHLIDFVTKKPVTAKGLVFTGKTSPWEVCMDMARVKTKINLDYFRIAPPYVAKYLPLMPMKSSQAFVSLREGATPLVRSKLFSKLLKTDLYFKVESKNPTGSFKDRGSAVDISMAKEFGAKAITVASTGNMAASCACYAAAAHIPCFVFVPEGVPLAKLAQVISFGGQIVQVKGSYNDAAVLAKEVAEERGFYLAGDYAFRVEGQKTAAYEIIDQLLFYPPDIVILPIGCGTNIAAYAKGFNDYYELGLIQKKPQIIGVQAAGAAPVVNAFAQQKSTYDALDHVETIASAIAVADPLDGLKALDAIYSSGGQAVAVSDEDLLRTQYMLATKEGLFVEASAAASLAGLSKLSQQNFLSGKRVVCILTGDGLKDTSIVLKGAVKPPTIYPDKDKFNALFESGFFHSKNVIFTNIDTVLFDKKPSLEQVKRQCEEIFESRYSDEHHEKIKMTIGHFLQKGKAVTIADFQDIVQDVRETLIHKVKEVFSVVDFEVSTGKDKVPSASVVVDVHGKRHTASATGTGPVDAVINALRKACQGEIDFKLTSYKVDIRSQGVDAGVYVELKLVKDHFISFGHATSPDVIQASIEAFEEAYNGFM